MTMQKVDTQEVFEIIKEFCTDKQHIATLKQIHDMALPQYMMGIIPILEGRVKDQVPESTELIQWIIKQGTKDYYVWPPSPEQKIVMINRNRKLVACIGLVTPHEDVKHLVRGHKALEVDHIYSFKKGQAYHFMQKFLALKNKMQLPMVLWCDNDEIKAYWEKYGFVNKGKLGGHGEYLMVLD